MIELGKVQTLTVQREKDFGVYMGEPGDEKRAVLLPRKQVPEGTKVGDSLEVFVYKDSEDRLIATSGKPKLQVGETAVLTVKDVVKIGAFLDMGLEKDLLLPFKEQNHRVRPGEECLVALYIDKSGRLAATMNVYSYMSAESPYQKDDWVKGVIYEISETLGAFVAVDNRYYGLIPKKELYGNYHPGDLVEARVMKVREDGKLDVGTAVGQGMLGVIKDLKMREPYIGQVPLQTGEIGDDIAFYYMQSEQTPSVVALGVLVDRDYSVKCAGGYIIQVMPECDDATLTKLENSIQGLMSVTEMLDKGMSVEEMLKYVMLGFDIEILETMDVGYKCDYSKERMERAIISLGKGQIQSIIDETGEAEICCHFCDRRYTFGEEDLKKFLETAK